MKGMSAPLFFIISVIIGGTLLLVLFNVVNLGGQGIEDIVSSGQKYQERLANMDSLQQACYDWLNGDKYKADAILNTYKLPNKMRPYDDLWRDCGDTMDELANKCYKQTEADYECAGKGYIKAGELEMCIYVCDNINTLHDKCVSACPDSKLRCFEYGLQEVDLSERDFELSTNELEMGCGE